MTGRIQRNQRFRGGGFQRGQRPFWHTTLLAKSCVLYLYPRAGSKTAACAPLKHRLLFLHCGVKRALLLRKRTFERSKRNGDVTAVTAPIPGRTSDRGIQKPDNEITAITNGAPRGNCKERLARYLLLGSHLSENVTRSLPCRGEDRRQSRSGNGGRCFP